MSRQQRAVQTPARLLRRRRHAASEGGFLCRNCGGSERRATAAGAGGRGCCGMGAIAAASRCYRGDCSGVCVLTTAIVSPPPLLSPQCSATCWWPGSCVAVMVASRMASGRCVYVCECVGGWVTAGWMGHSKIRGFVIFPVGHLQAVICRGGGGGGGADNPPCR